MNRALVVIGLLLLGSLTLCAQNGASGAAGSATFSTQDLSRSSTNAVIYEFNSAAACPIDMHARQGVWDHTITVHHGADQFKGFFGQRILLTLIDTRPARIVAATVLVRGFNGKNRMMQTGSAEGNATKTLRTGLTPSENNTALADLYIAGFTAVTSIKLQDVTYSDGSTWHSNQSNPCRVAPDPLMLVAEH